MTIHTHVYTCCLTAFVLLGLAANAGAAPCDDPMSIFSNSLKKELQQLENVIGLRSRADLVASVMSKKKQTLCRQISTKVIDMNGAIESIRLFRYRLFYCEKADSPEPSALAKESARQNKLTGERMLLAIGRFCGQVSITATIRERYAYIHELQSEFFCIDVSEQDMLPDFFSEVFRDFPPFAEIRAVGKALCERLRDREIEIETARYELEAAKLRERKKLGDNELVANIALATWAVGRNLSDDHPYYWRVMSFVGLTLLLIFFPLYLLGERLGWYWTEHVSAWVFLGFNGVAVLSLLYQLDLDDYSKILGLVASIAVIFASVIGAAVGLKKLLSRSDSK